MFAILGMTYIAALVSSDYWSSLSLSENPNDYSQRVNRSGRRRIQKSRVQGKT
jgi:hypothetical protein